MRAIAEQLGNKALFIGGVAVECYAPYRRTHDIDLVVREQDFPELRSLLAGMNFSHHRPPHLVRHSFKGREAGQVDVYMQSVGEMKLDEGLFRRGREVSYGGTRIFAVSLEDLVGFKVAAGREMDLSDVAVLFHERGRELDFKLLEDLVGVKSLRHAAPTIAGLLPEEYGWQARQRLKSWLRERGWLVPTRKAAPQGRRRGS